MDGATGINFLYSSDVELTGMFLDHSYFLIQDARFLIDAVNFRPMHAPYPLSQKKISWEFSVVHRLIISSEF